jgi:hypothetical protein
MRKLFPGLFKQEPKYTDNLPDLIRKLNRTDLTKYDRLDTFEEQYKDPLMMRINTSRLNYIQQHNEEQTILKRLKQNAKYYLAKFNSRYRFDYILHRPNPELRTPHYGWYDNEKFTITNFGLFLMIAIGAYFVGYVYARFRYDVYFRRIMYIKYTSFMLAFELLDYHVSYVLDSIEYYFPRDFSQLEYEFIVYKKIKNYLRRRKLNKDIDLIVNTDPEIIEIDNLVKKIR